MVAIGYTKSCINGKLFNQLSVFGSAIVSGKDSIPSEFSAANKKS
jgi:hypothetical protein